MWPIGKVTLNVRAGSIILPTDFLVVDVPSTYNAIIGRRWLHKMKSISSTYHQMIKYPGADGIECIRGNQKAAQQCLVQIVQKFPKAHLVKLVKVLDQPILEDIGGDPTKKVVEGLKKVRIGDDPKRYFLIGKTLAEQDEQELVGFLREHIDIFAWTP